MNKIPESSTNCKCCGADSARRFSAREMQYGTREKFVYLECGDCGAMQIDEIPVDIAKYYRSEQYASWQSVPTYIDKPTSRPNRWLRAQRSRYLIEGRGVIGKMITQLLGQPHFRDTNCWEWFKAGKLTSASRVFDFGCGTGELLRQMRLAGFSNLYGYDKFCDVRISVPGLEVSDEWPTALEGSFDFVMAHHSLEHLPDPLVGLQKMKLLMRPDATMLVRVPLARSEAWRQYGADWIQLDAPRHLVIPSEEAMTALAEAADLKIDGVVFDSSDFQFLGSDQYSRDIPMFGDSRSYFNGNAALFSAEEVQDARTRAIKVNYFRRGDQACFYMRSRKD